jgi:hypothetical protein
MHGETIKTIALMSVHLVLNTAPLNCYLQTIFSVSTTHKNVARVHIGLNIRLKIIDIYTNDTALILYIYSHINVVIFDSTGSLSTYCRDDTY